MKIFRKVIQVTALLLMAGLLSCERSPESLDAPDYVKWVSSESKGFVKYKKVGPVTMTSRYLPAAFLAYREYIGTDKPDVSYDSIYNAYRCGLTFQFVLQAEKSDDRYGNLQYYGIGSEEEMRARIRMLNFSAGEFFSVTWKGNHYLPVMNAFEGYDAMENKLSFTVVFQIAAFNCSNPPENFDEVSFTFDDRFWGLGTNHFLFPKTVFQNKPKLRI